MSVRRAHMVSKGYLRAWADQRGRVDVVDIEQGREFKTTINRATVVSYAYESNVLTANLEDEYSRIESSAIPVFVKMCEGEKQLEEDEQRSVIKFLDMHLERGRYAGQVKISTLGVTLKADGSIKQADLNLSDRLLLTRQMNGPIRLTPLGLESWPWNIYPGAGLITGDGAVVPWRGKNHDLCTVTFPISPTKMLVIGKEIPLDATVNSHVVKNSRRWLVGEVDSLTK